MGSNPSFRTNFFLMADSSKLFCIQCGCELPECSKTMSDMSAFYCSEECAEEYNLPFYESTDPIEDE